MEENVICHWNDTIDCLKGRNLYEVRAGLEGKLQGVK